MSDYYLVYVFSTEDGDKRAPFWRCDPQLSDGARELLRQAVEARAQQADNAGYLPDEIPDHAVDVLLDPAPDEQLQRLAYEHDYDALQAEPDGLGALIAYARDIETRLKAGVAPAADGVKADILQAMHELGAATEDTRKTQEVIVRHALGNAADYNQYKTYFSELKAAGKIKTKGGSRGGSWLNI